MTATRHWSKALATDDLLPCPHCGSDSLEIYVYDGENNVCDDETYAYDMNIVTGCGGDVMLFDQWLGDVGQTWEIYCTCGCCARRETRSAAAEAWNRRVKE